MNDSERVEARRPPIRPKASWLEEVPVWSGIGSVVLMTAVLAFDEPHMGQYALLFIAQLFYLASVLMRD